MTRKNTLTLASAMMAVALVAAVPMQAQQGGPPPGPMGHRGGMMAGHWNPPSVDERVQRMSGELNLTPEQSAKLKTLMTAEQRSMDSTRAVRAVQFEAERKAMEARRAEHEKALLAILTPEQRAKHEALAKQHRGPMMRGRGPGGPADGPHGDHHGPGEEEGTTR